MHGIIIAGTESGAGKTTAALGLIDLFTRRELKVQPFKAGPDFIDPSLHTILAGRPSRNLDSYLLTPNTIRHLFSRQAVKADLNIIEGVAGLFDGYNGLEERGSTAQIAKILGCPIILVVNARSSARSLAAVVRGFQNFDKKIKIAGVFLNNLAGPRHLEWAQTAIEQNCRIPVLGFLYAAPDLCMKERHMGLVPSAENKLDPKWLLELRRQMDKNTCWKHILEIGKVTPIRTLTPKLGKPLSQKVRIGIAKDAAFHFYYQDNLDLLTDLGADLVPFSPIKDQKLPKGLDALYLGGGFPEVFSAELEENNSMRREISAGVKSGLPVYAECGGLMYLGQSIQDARGKKHKMAGALPYETEMTPKISMAYLMVQARQNNLLANKGESFPGQVFHFSKMKALSPLKYAWRLNDGMSTQLDGISHASALASYVHVHFWSRPALAENWLRKIQSGIPS